MLFCYNYNVTKPTKVGIQEEIMRDFFNIIGISLILFVIFTIFSSFGFYERIALSLVPTFILYIPITSIYQYLKA